MVKTFEAADLFCGGGGTTEGMSQAAASRGLRLNLMAVNHWQTAIDTHTANHPSHSHWRGSLASVEPQHLIPSRRLDALVASPECTDHSRNKNGKPRNDQSRAGAWSVVDWLASLTVEEVLIENVPEWEKWGPLGADGHPLKSRQGETFTAWCRAVESLNYSLDVRKLRAADYGDPTTRERLFVRARRCRRRITWPTPTHSRDGVADMFEGQQRQRWRPAREIIDWSNRGTSIFTRPNPLKPNTIARIAAGIRKFWGEWAEPFLLILRNNQNAMSIDGPVPTITTSGAHVGLVQPFLVSCCHGEGLERRTHDIEKPIPTITGSNQYGLIQPFIIPQFSGQEPKSIDEPINAITTTSRGIALCQPFILPYYTTGRAQSIDEPLNTVTTRDRFGIVRNCGLDILFRMLTDVELALAMGFPAHYRFSGNRCERVKQIGNAVPVGLARALTGTMMEAA